MAWTRSLILLLGLAACSPAPQKDAQKDISTDATPMIKTASVSARGGHTPFPVDGYHPGIYLFHGYRCGTDCLLHQKGYQWGSEHKVADPKDCRGTSEEFIEGCLAFTGIEGPLGERDFDVSFPHMSGIN
jgi:hypothetical protein